MRGEQVVAIEGDVDFVVHKVLSVNFCVCQIQTWFISVYPLHKVGFLILKIESSSGVGLFSCLLSQSRKYILAERVLWLE